MSENTVMQKGSRPEEDLNSRPSLKLALFSHSHTRTHTHTHHAGVFLSLVALLSAATYPQLQLWHRTTLDGDLLTTAIVFTRELHEPRWYRLWHPLAGIDLTTSRDA